MQVALWKLKDGGNAGREADYELFCYSGTTMQMVIRTGKRVSYLAGEAGVSDYEWGRYLFTDLPAGIYAVKYTHGEETPDISGLTAALTNQGGASEVQRDSDGVPSYDELTLILGIELPHVEEMSVMKFESRYHDSGFYQRGYELPETGGVGTLPYTLGGALLATAVLCLLCFQCKRKRRT